MKTNLTRFILFFFSLIAIQSAFGAPPVAGDYRSKGTGIAGGPWSTISNWETYNGSAWVAAIASPTSSDGVITIQATDSIVLNSAISIDQVVVSGGATLAIYNLSTATTVTLNDGTGDDISVDGRLYVASNATLSGAGSIMVNSGGLFSFRNGCHFATTLTIAAGGFFEVPAVAISAPNIENTTVTNNGTAWWVNQNINFTNANFVNNGTFYALGNNNLNNTSGTNSFSNTGTFTKNTGVGTTIINIPFTNTGAFNINTGTLQNFASTATFTNSGPINFSGSAALTNNAGTIILNSGSSFSGTVTLTNTSSGVITFNTPLSVDILNLNAGTINGSSSLTIGSTLSWLGGTLGVPTTINSGATASLTTATTKTVGANLTNNGTFTWTAGNISFAGGVFTNNNLITENFTANQSMLYGSGSGNAFVNNGTFSKTSSFTYSNATFVPVTNNGTIQGTGTYTFISTDITNPGTISPGNSPGVLTVSPTAITGQSPTIKIELLNNSGVGTGTDQLIVTNTTDISGAKLSVTENTSMNLASYVIMQASSGTFTGNFASVLIPLGYVLDPYTPGVSTTISVTKTSTTLPVAWGNFTALASTNKVLLKWTTLQEVNTSSFIVEYSEDGQSYRPIATLAARGNSSIASDYSFTHISPDLSKNNFYRIKEVDLDGKINYSPVRTVRFSKGSVVVVQVMPNPVKDVLQLSVQSNDIRIVLTDLSGRMVRSQIVQPGLQQIDVQNLSKGVYQLSVYQKDEKVSSQQIIKL